MESCGITSGKQEMSAVRTVGHSNIVGQARYGYASTLPLRGSHLREPLPTLTITEFASMSAQKKTTTDTPMMPMIHYPDGSGCPYRLQVSPHKAGLSNNLYVAVQRLERTSIVRYPSTLRLQRF